MNKAVIVSVIMRVMMGIIFIVHGITKLQMGLSNVDAWFSSMGIPGFLAYLVFALELAGGIMLILGLFTRYVSALFVIMLIGATLTTKLSAGLLGNDQMPGFELEIGFILISLYLAVADKSPLSIDRFMKKRSA
ncbi:DoxX family protein [Paenibacillus planticolens]|uniref:DoxX family membrane protein n=1 Tax=Paenibacillus planticolens TaxID=2654976 RepID=A0ABX1ZUG2_9BACL|nr:DoxX family protein [Paenibacillus planticolens]NOV02280.1 DoxX family membrane protein [Paenibacillus planticolens]